MPKIHSAFSYYLQPRKEVAAADLAREMRIPYPVAYSVMTGRTRPSPEFIAQLLATTTLQLTQVFTVEPLPEASQLEPLAPLAKPIKADSISGWVRRDPDLEPSHSSKVAWEWWAYRQAVKAGRFKRASGHRAAAEALEHGLTPDQEADRATAILKRLKAGKHVKPY